MRVAAEGGVIGRDVGVRATRGGRSSPQWKIGWQMRGVASIVSVRSTVLIVIIGGIGGSSGRGVGRTVSV